MVGNTSVLMKVSALGAAVALAASCTSQVGSKADEVSAFAPKPANLRLNLTDAPNDDLTSVVVDIARVELSLSKGGKGARVAVAQNLGPVDLLTLQDGKILPMHDLDIPDGVDIRQIRLILKEEGHFAVKKNGEICPLQTPSAQQSGLKLLMKNSAVVRDGYSYSLVVDFDAKKSVVVRGKGDCLLKPVLKVLSLSEIRQDLVNEDGSTDSSGSELITDGSDDGSAGSGSDGSTDGSTDGSAGSGSDGSTDGSTDGSAGSGSDGSTDGSTSETVVIDPNDPSSWEEIPEEELPQYF